MSGSGVYRTDYFVISILNEASRKSRGHREEFSQWCHPAENVPWCSGWREQKPSQLQQQTSSIYCRCVSNCNKKMITVCQSVTVWYFAIACLRQTSWILMCYIILLRVIFTHELWTMSGESGPDPLQSNPFTHVAHSRRSSMSHVLAPTGNSL